MIFDGMRPAESIRTWMSDVLIAVGVNFCAGVCPAAVVTVVRPNSAHAAAQVRRKTVEGAGRELATAPVYGTGAEIGDREEGERRKIVGGYRCRQVRSDDIE